MLLKTQSLFLAGDDVAKEIEPSKIGRDMVSHVFSLADEFAKLPSWLEAVGQEGFERSMRQWFSRSAPDLKSRCDRSNRFTRDLYLCYEQFAEFYPQRPKQIYRVLENCLSGEDSPVQYRELVAFLTNESKRLFAL